MAFLSSIFFLPSSRLESCDAIAFHIVHCKLFCCTFLFVVVQLHWYAPSDAMLAECECGKSVCFWRLVKLLSSLARFQRVCVCVSVCRMEVDMSVVHDSEWWRTLSHCFISDFINTHTHTRVRCLFVGLFSCQCLVCLTFMKYGETIPVRWPETRKKQQQRR